MSKYKSDFFSVLIILVVVVMVLFGSLMFANFFRTGLGQELSEVVQDMNITENTYANDTANIIKDDTTEIADNFAFWTLIAVILGLFISGLFLDFELPIVAIMFLVASIAVYGSMQVANMYYDFYTSDPDLTVTAGLMTKTQAVYGSYFPIIIFVSFIVSLIIMYARKRGGGYYGQ